MNRRPTINQGTLQGDSAKATSNASLLTPARFAMLATVMLSGVLASSTLVTADSISVYEGKSLPQVLAIMIALLFAALGILPLLPGSPRGRLGIGLLTALVLWLLVSTFAGASLGHARMTWNGFWHLLGIIGFGVGLRATCQSVSASRAVLHLVLFCATFQSVYALHQYAISMPTARAAYIADPEGELLKAEIDAPPGSALRAQYEGRLLSSFEPSATFALTNSLAVLLSGALIAWAILLVRGGAIQTPNRNVSVPRRSLALTFICAVAWLVMVAAWLLTKSRTGVLAVIVMAVIASAMIGFLHRSTRRATSAAASSTDRGLARWIVGGVLAIVISFALLLGLLSSDMLILSEAPKSVAYRIEYWQATAKMIFDHPWTGIGMGNFQSYYPRYKLPAASEIIADPHNWCFDIAACSSMPVLILVLAGFVTAVVHSWNKIAWLHAYEISRAIRPQPDLIQDSQTQSTNLATSSPFVEPNELGGAGLVWIGAGVGWLVTALLQMIARESFDIDASLLSLIAGGLAVIALRLCTAPSRATIRLAALAAFLTMLLALLASGSWQASGLALPMVALLAINLSATSTNNSGSSSTTGATRRDVLAGKPQIVGVVGMLTLLLVFLFQTWYPVNTSWSASQRAVSDFKAGDFQGALVHVQQSIAADTFNTDSRRLLVQIYVTGAEELTNGEQNRFQSLRGEIGSALEGLLQVGSVSYLNWSFASQTMTTLAASGRRIGDPAAATECLTRAAEFNSEAIARYPSSVALHAQQATLCMLLDQKAESQKELGMVFALSQSTPHEDRRLNKQQLWLPASLVPNWPEAAVVRVGGVSNWVEAEPLCNYLRTVKE